MQPPLERVVDRAIERFSEIKKRAKANKVPKSFSFAVAEFCWHRGTTAFSDFLSILYEALIFSSLSLICNPWVALLGLNGVPAGQAHSSALCWKEPQSPGAFARVWERNRQQREGRQRAGLFHYLFARREFLEDGFKPLCWGYFFIVRCFSKEGLLHNKESVFCFWSLKGSSKDFCM